MGDRKQEGQKSAKKNPAFNAVEVRPGVRGFISKSDRPVSKNPIAIRLFKDQMTAFDQLCDSSGLSRSAVVRELIDMYLGHQNNATSIASKGNEYNC